MMATRPPVPSIMPFTQVSPPLLAPCYQPTIQLASLAWATRSLLFPIWFLYLAPVPTIAPSLLHLQPRWAFTVLGPIPASYNLRSWYTSL